MSISPDRQRSDQTPEQFAAYLRCRAEESISASVHHASLSQQYLTLSQKFAALAEQAAGNPLSFSNTVEQLEREAATGAPAGPIGIPQAPIQYSTANLSSSVPQNSPLNGWTQQDFSAPFPPSSTETTTPFFSPPAKFLPPEPPDESVVGTGDSKQVAAAAKRTPASRKNRRKNILLRKVMERARLVTLERADRVRVRAKKSDLKPRLRKASQEIKEELKRGRGPAAISTFVLTLALVVLAYRQLEFVEEKALPPLVAGFSDTIEPVEESLPVELPAEEVGEQQEQPEEEPVDEMEEELQPEPTPKPELLPEAMPEVEVAEAALPETPEGAIQTNPDAASNANAVDTRSETGRKAALEKFGGSAASESAVGFALEWLAARQRANGTWDFIDVGPCKNPGSVNNPIGGTAYALLPFLAAGQTHKEGQYRKQVLAGLEFLTSIGVRAPAGYDLRGVLNKSDNDKDPNYAYYVHGAATLALCEAYGMTKDRKLKSFAEEAAKFLVNSQDPRGGGWRYNPQQPGSTSATAIQVMALKAAEKAGIKIPDGTWTGATFYLDSVSVDGEGRYGYEVEKKTYGVSVTSMAMLSRMYLGWGRNDGDMRAGIALIDKRGPYDNLYYNYFATQAMKNWGGDAWSRWNMRLRDDLITWQETEGDAKGSWTPRDRDDYSKAGGRLLTTCLATLTLEVYYRYKPLLPELEKKSDVVAD